MKRILFLVVFFILGVSITYFMIKPSKEKSLPVINPVDVNEEMVDPELLRIGYGHKIGNFSFLNQDGKLVTQQDVKGKVFVAEYFFTTCGTICPIMNVQMQRVHKVYQGNKNVRILSFTVDPKVDTVAQMKRYAVAHGADAESWFFLTGTQEKLYELARKSFFVLKPAETENQGDVGSDFIHTNNFVLVDKEMRIRGYYDGTNSKEVDELIGDIALLVKEK
jgi:protein SCO1/2